MTPLQTMYYDVVRANELAGHLRVFIESNGKTFFACSTILITQCSNNVVTQVHLFVLSKFNHYINHIIAYIMSFAMIHE